MDRALPLLHHIPGPHLFPLPSVLTSLKLSPYSASPPSNLSHTLLLWELSLCLSTESPQTSFLTPSSTRMLSRGVYPALAPCLYASVGVLGVCPTSLLGQGELAKHASLLHTYRPLASNSSYTKRMSALTMPLRTRKAEGRDRPEGEHPAGKAGPGSPSDF